MIRQYSLAKDGNCKLAPSFNTREFRCRDGTETKHSNGYFLAKKNYTGGMWSKAMLQMLVARDRLTAAEYEEITGEKY